MEKLAKVILFAVLVFAMMFMVMFFYVAHEQHEQRKEMEKMNLQIMRDVNRAFENSPMTTPNQAAEYHRENERITSKLREERERAEKEKYYNNKGFENQNPPSKQEILNKLNQGFQEVQKGSE